MPVYLPKYLCIITVHIHNVYAQLTTHSPIYLPTCMQEQGTCIHIIIESGRANTAIYIIYSLRISNSTCNIVLISYIFQKFCCITIPVTMKPGPSSVFPTRQRNVYWRLIEAFACKARGQWHSKHTCTAYLLRVTSITPRAFFTTLLLRRRRSCAASPSRYWVYTGAWAPKL